MKMTGLIAKEIVWDAVYLPMDYNNYCGLQFNIIIIIFVSKTLSDIHVVVSPFFSVDPFDT